MSLLSSLRLPSLSSFIPSFLTNNPIYKNQNARTIFFTIGAAVVLSKAISLAKGLFSLISFPKDLPTRYGRGSWVVITGASDGIGKGFALELARQGFNIVLVSRTQEKLEEVAKEIRTNYPTVQTRIVVSDFAKAYNKEFAEDIYNQVKDLDISILVNNAGTGLRGKLYLEADVHTIRNLIVLNSLSHALILRVFLPQLAARKQKTAIINVGSLAAVLPIARGQVYSASKVFIDYLSRGLTYEHPNIDILSFKPGTVDTNLTKGFRPGGDMITVKECVDSALRAVGNTDETFGHWKHRRFNWILSSLPDFLMRKYQKKRANQKLVPTEEHKH